MKRYTIAILVALLGSCSGINCPFNRPSCCDNAMFGCGPFDLPQGCSCSDYFSRSFNGAPTSKVSRVSARSGAVRDSSWRIRLTKKSGTCSYLPSEITGTLLVRTQGNRAQVKLLGYPKMRASRSSRSLRARGMYFNTFPSCQAKVSGQMQLGSDTSSSVSASVSAEVGVSCQNTALSCNAGYSGIAQRQ